jgi:DNA-binding Lrp family transcriptional regulator
MSEKLDLMDLKILEGIGIHGPRNITRVARKLGIKAETLRKRLKRMPSHLFFRFHANIYCSNLGLKKSVVFAEATPGHEDLLLNCLKANDFWIYLNRCYGMNEGCFGIYTIPKDHYKDFEQFLQSLETMGVAKNIQIFWSTCFQSVNSKTNWFDEQSKTWVYSWDKWVEEIPTKDTQLPYTLVDPKDYPIEGDEIDVFILKELEKNPTISLRALAKILGVSQQVVEYHYRKHILERNLIENFEVFTLHYDLAVSDIFVFIFRFDSVEKCAKFAASLLDKPFVGGLGKVLGENAIIGHVYLPRLDFRKFIDTLSKLARAGLLYSYDYVILDLRKAQRQTISYEYFKNGSWIYDHNKHIQNLRDLVEGAKLERRASPVFFSAL